MADDQQQTPPPPAPNPYTSVVYVHGIGSQRRYEELGRLIDRLDTWQGDLFRAGQAIGPLKGVEVQIEPLRGREAEGGTIAYIRAKLDVADPNGRDGRRTLTVRFYEIYWAPAMREVKSPWAVARWLARCAVRPLATLRSPWRERQRLRRSVLVAMMQRAASADQNDYRKLLDTYHRFEGLPAHRSVKGDKFAYFLDFVAEAFAKKPDAKAKRLALARAWRRAYRWQEARTAFALASVGLTILLLAGALLAGTLGLVQSLLRIRALSHAVRVLDLPFRADGATVATIAISLLGLLGVGRFLTDYLGDVEAWSTYRETDAKNAARETVLREATTTLKHVLNDPRCDRVAVVAHSLGTSIAHDALLAINRANRATYATDPIKGPVPLLKIEHFVTMGSPIDKIEYFFESYVSRSHRYKRVMEALRGDIGTPPFSRNGDPHVHWVNYWDAGDPISGALDSPASADPKCQHVDNVRIDSFGVTLPGKAHGGYFDDATVIRQLFDMIFHRRWSFVPIESVDHKPPDYASAYLGSAAPPPRVPIMLAAAIVPWAALASLLAWASDHPMVAAAAGVIAVAGVLAYIATAVASTIRGHRNPL